MVITMDRITVTSYILTVVALIGTLMLGLLPALLAGFLIYQLVDFGARVLGRVGVIPAMGKIILLVVVALIVIAALTGAAMFVASNISDGPESVVALLRRMADVVDVGRTYLPAWTQQYLPTNIEEWQVAAASWLRSNALHLSVLGREAGYFVVHVLIGMVIGGMMALSPAFQEIRGPLSQTISDRLDFMARAFSRVVFSQIRISALNTVLTGIFLTGIMPAMGVDLPLTKTMIAVTFVAGLLPIIGNLISNTVITLIALSVSPMAAISALVYLMVIHKLEYFFNARIIGSQIRARAWEILLAMIVMESIFGIAGVVAAPIYYAWMKDELSARRLI